jgi:hypothetical protein
VAARVSSWFGPKGGKIGIGFDDEHFAWTEMEIELDSMRQAHPNLPDEVPSGTTFVFVKEGTGHLSARFRVGDTVYRSGAQPAPFVGDRAPDRTTPTSSTPQKRFLA